MKEAQTPGNSLKTTSAKEELMRLGRDWDRAIVSNNAEAIEKYMADDWVIIGSDGVTSKEKFLDLVRSGILQHSKMDFEDVRVEIYDDTGIVTSKGTSAGTYDGHLFSSYEWTSSVFIKKEVGWICVMTMITTVKNHGSV